MDQCPVGFLPKALAMGQTSTFYNDKLLKITEIYGESDSAFKRSKHHRNHGLARAVMLEEEEEEEEDESSNKDNEEEVEDDSTSEEDQPMKKKTKNL